MERRGTTQHPTASAGARTVGIVCLALAGCVSVPGPALAASAAQRGGQPGIAQPLLTFEEKMSWILMLEDRRILRDPAPPPAPAPVPQVRGKGKKNTPPPPPPPSPDVLRLLTDSEARIRRRAALAIGRVGLVEGVTPLSQLLSNDAEPEVRQMAAFGLGLIGSQAAVAPLRAALSDPSPMVQGRAAEALGLLGDTSSASVIATMVSGQATAARPGALAADDFTYPQPPPVEAFRLGIYALTRLKAWEALVALLVDRAGQPVSRWWPVAFALSRLEDPRAVPALLALAGTPEGRTTRAFAARGLGTLKAASAVSLLVPMAEDWKNDMPAAAQAIRSLGQIGQPDAALPLRRLAQTRGVDPNIRLEALTALGELRDAGSYDLMLDLLVDSWPAMRAAALRGAQAIDPDNFLTILSSLDADVHVNVRIALASILTKVNPEQAIPRLMRMTADGDARVVAAAIGALAQLKAPDLGPRLPTFLTADDVMVRAAAANALAELKVAGAETALAKAYRDWAKDGSYAARAAALSALRQVGASAAMPVLREALADKDWAVRVRAAALIRELDPQADVAAAMRPGPPRSLSEYARPALVNPAVSPHVYFDTDKGTIEIELAVIDAPQTCANFLRLAQDGFFSGVAIHRVVPNFVVQDGDPRGDGEGSPGYTIRDEINQQPYMRGTVGMALDWADTGGSQWFVTHSPQPHLDGRYTVFGRVVAGMEVVDLIQQGDVVRHVRTWDGVMMHTR